MRPLVAIARWFLIIALWTLTVGAVLFGLAAFARIFTGDEQFGALDGFQFTDALYKATFRFVLAAVAALALYRVLGWRPGRSEPVGPVGRVPEEPAISDSSESDKPFKGRPRAWVIPEDEPVDE